MSQRGPPDDAGPPDDVREMLPDRAVERLTARFQQGEEVAEAEFTEWTADLGNGRAMFTYPDGRVVTLAPDEVVEIR